MKGNVIDIVAVVAFPGGIAGDGIEHPVVFPFGKAALGYSGTIDIPASFAPQEPHAAQARKRDNRIAGKPPQGIAHPLHGKALVVEDARVRFKTGNFVHHDIPLGPYGDEQVVRRLEQVVEPLRIRKPYLVHRRDRDRVLVVLLEREQVVVAVIPRFKIESPVLPDGVLLFSQFGPLAAGGSLVNRTIIGCTIIFCHVTFPNNFFLVVEVHADLSQPVRHQVIHNERVLFNPVIDSNRGGLVALHMADRDGILREHSVFIQTINPFPSLCFYSKFSPVR